MTRSFASMTFVFAAALAACGGASQTGASAPGGGEDGEAAAARGAKLYADNCASCHGANGEGDKDVPAVVGKDALPLDPRPSQKSRKVQFHTALDVGQWVAKNMPPTAPGSLAERDYWDILAFDLKANGVPVAGKPINGATAADVKLH